MIYDNIKSHKEPGFHTLSLEDTLFEKPQLKVTKNQGFTLSLEDTLFEKPQGGQNIMNTIVGKFQAIILDKRKTDHTNERITVDNKQIKVVSSVKLLRLQLDDKLYFNLHI